MWKKHKKEILMCLVAPIIIVFLMLLIVVSMEYFEIHVPDTRQTWMGFIGAVIGGAFTLIGVLLSIYMQEENEDENKRLLNMPILGFSADYTEKEGIFVLTCTDNTLITSAFNIFENKEYVTVTIKVSNNLPAFNFTVESCVINGKLINIGSAFNPCKVRIIADEVTSFNFDYDGNTNIFCLLRFSYEDIFGNKYYQDLPFIYYETSIVSDKCKKKVRQHIELRDIKQPKLIEQAKKLEDEAKEYIDYR